MQRWRDLGQSGALGDAHVREDREVLLRKGHPADAAWMLLDGAVEILQPGIDGTSVVVKLLVAPTLFGVIELLGDEAHWLEDVRVLGRATVVRLPRERFLDVVKHDAVASYECLRDVGTAFCVAARHEPSRLHAVETLLANALLAYVDACGERWDGGVRLQVKRTQADLAQAIGKSERAVNTVLSGWRDAGVVDKVEGRYLVHQRAILETLAGELLGSLVHAPHGVPPPR